jgi:hypothetical protein
MLLIFVRLSAKEKNIKEDRADTEEGEEEGEEKRRISSPVREGTGISMCV